MSEFESHEPLPREAEVLRARRESLERLREVGTEPFALRFDVDTHAAPLLEEFDGRLDDEEESDRRASVAGRVVLARRHGKLTFLVISDRTGDLQLFCEEATLGEGYGLLDEVDLGDIVGSSRPRRPDASRRAVAQGGLADDAHEGAASAPREVARTAGSRPAAATPIPPPHHRSRGASVRRRAGDRPPHDATGAGRSRVHRGRNARPPGHRRRRVGEAVHDASQRAGHRPQAPDLARAVPEAVVGRWARADLRDRQELPQRGHRPRTQPGVHDARALRGLR